MIVRPLIVRAPALPRAIGLAAAGLAAGLAVVTTASCAEEIAFAKIALTVREPQDKERFGSDALTGLQWTFDKKLRASVSFDPTGDVETLDINLGQSERNVDVVVFIGAKRSAQAVGRAAPFFIPALDQESLEPQETQAANVFLAQPYVPELLVDNTPDVRENTAACDSAEGKVLLVGGADNAYLLGGSLTVTEIVRDYDTVGREVACDFADADNEAIAVHGDCGGAGGYELTLGLGSRNDVVTIDGDQLCDPFLRVAGDVIWIASSTFVALHRLSNGERIASVPLPELFNVVRHALADDDSLIVQGNAFDGVSATAVVRRLGDTLDVVEGVALARFQAADPSGRSILFADGSVAVPAVVGDAVALSGARPSRLTIAPTRIVVISANDEDPRKERVVGIDADGTVQMEGEDPIETGRETMAVTFGDALLLFGKLLGHDVLVAPLTPFEREPLTPPPEDGEY